MSGLFITGSGTGVGKTLFTGLLAQQLIAAGRKVRVLKPVISGFDPQTLDDSDSGQLLRAIGHEVTEDAIREISPWRFAAPLSPDMAAAREGRDINFDCVAAFCQEALHAVEQRGHTVLIEGVGGVLVPLTKDRTVADWIAALGIPALVVSGSYLGALSHALTAVEALHSRDIQLAGIVISESSENPVPLAETAATLRRFVGDCPVVTLPRVCDADRIGNIAQDFTFLL